MKFVDLHCDTILQFYAGKHLDEMTDTHISLFKLQQGGTMAQCFAIFVPTNDSAARHGVPEGPEDYFERAYAAYLREMERCKAHILPAYCVGDILAHDEAGLLSSILTVEDSVTLNGDVTLVDDYYARGVRMATLTWNYENTLGFPQNADHERHMLGLKPFGIEVVRRMNELGIAVDVSHLSEGGFWDVIRTSTKPVIASHSCARALCDHPRNLTDDQIRALAKTGGVIGVNFCTTFMHPVSDRYTTLEDVRRHVRHLADIGGIETVAMGSDYDGIGNTMEWRDAGGNGLIADLLTKELGSHDAELICSKNALRALKDNIG